MPTKRKAPKAARRKTAPKAKAAVTSKAKAAPRTSLQAATRASDPHAPQVRTPSAPRTIFDILHPGAATGFDPSFRDAPDGWSPDHARTLAAAANIELTDDHWEVIRVLQGCYKDELSPRIRLLRDALEARFASKGGMKYLFAILPGGPIAQGCTLAGVKPPHGARDLSFGSVA
jgi:TusE/DsrC/DsvC family sulfur relay protein